MRYKNGSRARVGRNCAIEHFGVVFHQQLQSFDTAKSRKAQLAELLKLRELIPGAVANIGRIRESQSISQFDNCRLDFGGRFHMLLAVLRGLQLHRDGVLVSERMVRDYAAEDRAAENSQEGKELFRNVQEAKSKSPGILKAALHRQKKWRTNQLHKLKAEEVSFGKIFGGEVWLAPNQLHKELAKISIGFRSVQQQLYGSRSDEWPDGRIARVLREVRELVQNVREAARPIDRLNSFGDPKNLKAISFWTIADSESERPRYGSKIETDGRTLRTSGGENSRKAEVTFYRVEALALPEIEALAAALFIN